MTVIDSSGIVDLLLQGSAFAAVEDLIKQEGELAAPDVLVFEVLSVMRREAARDLSVARAAAAVRELGRVSLALFSSLPLRHRVWDLRANLTVADATFIALAEELDEPLATKDARLARAASEHTDIAVHLLGTDG